MDLLIILIKKEKWTTKQEYEKLYSKLTSKLSNDELEQLNKYLFKFKISEEDLRILNAFYMPEDDKKIIALEELSPSQMNYELRNLFVLLRNNYSGYDYFNKKGELDNLKNAIEEKVNGINHNMKTTEFFEIVSKDLNKVIKDNHIYFDCNGEIFNLGTCVAPYFTDVVVEKDNDTYVVINENIFFNKGYIIRQNIDNYIFRTLPSSRERF